MQEAALPPAPGPRFGRYELLRRVSLGGASELFKAKARGPGGFEKIVALKRLLPHAQEHPDYVRMFLVEGQLVAQLDHPLVARTYELGEVGDVPFIAMEFIYGQDLGALRKQLTLRGQLPGAELVAAIGLQAAQALAYTHDFVDASGEALEIVHRDVSPRNLMVSHAGAVSLIDFGIAKYTGCDLRTRTGVVKGKHGYMSPEQVRREALDRRSNLFSLGVVLYELATGQRLFRGSSVFETMSAVEAADVAPLGERAPHLPRALAEVITRCVARDPDARPADATEVARVLQAQLAEGGDPRAVVAPAYRRLFGDAGATEDEVTLVEYQQALRALEHGEAGKAADRARSDITLIVADETDLASYLADLGDRLHHPPASGTDDSVTAA